MQSGCELFVKSLTPRHCEQMPVPASRRNVRVWSLVVAPPIVVPELVVLEPATPELVVPDDAVVDSAVVPPVVVTVAAPISTAAVARSLGTAATVWSCGGGPG